MARKSNKTEQVMKLITKDSGEQNAVSEETLPVDVEIDVKPPAKKEHKIETKLKIEIEPEIEVKSKVKKDEHAKSGTDAHEPVKDEASVRLINLTEFLVREKSEEMMEKLNVCSCPDCRLDVLALALNALPNKYITTNEGRLHVQLEIYKKQYETDIVAALAKACVRVKVSPRHKEQE
jgi:competence protein ComFB